MSRDLQPPKWKVAHSGVNGMYKCREFEIMVCSYRFAAGG